MYSFGVLGGNTLATVLFQGAAEAPPILYAEVLRVTHADLFVVYDVATNNPNRGCGIIKGGMKKSQADLFGSGLRVVSVRGRRWYHKHFESREKYLRE